jgi:hypothetical protein
VSNDASSDDSDSGSEEDDNNHQAKKPSQGSKATAFKPSAQTSRPAAKQAIQVSNDASSEDSDDGSEEDDNNKQAKKSSWASSEDSDSALDEDVGYDGNIDQENEESLSSVDEEEHGNTASEENGQQDKSRGLGMVATYCRLSHLVINLHLTDDKRYFHLYENMLCQLCGEPIGRKAHKDCPGCDMRVCKTCVDACLMNGEPVQRNRKGTKKHLED